MTQPSEAPRRFYKTTGALPVDGGFAVQLDGRTVRTPGATSGKPPGVRTVRPSSCTAKPPSTGSAPVVL